MEKIRELVKDLSDRQQKLDTTTAEIRQNQERGSEIKNQIFAIEKDLVKAQAEEKATVTAFARGKVTQDAIKAAQCNVLTLTSELNCMKSVMDVIALDLAALEEAKKDQGKVFGNRNDRIWSLIEAAELAKAQVFVDRAKFANQQKQFMGFAGRDHFAKAVTDLIHSRDDDGAIAAALIAEYQL